MRPFIATLFCMLMNCVFSQNLNSIHYTTNNSKLPHDIIYKLRQDKAGYIWICTDDGLVRFDGVEMVPFDKGFISRYVICTDEDRGRTWAATWKGGIQYIKNDSAYTVNTDPGFARSFLFNTNNIIAFNDLIIVHNFDDYMIFKFDSLKNLLVNHSITKDAVRRTCLSSREKKYLRFFKSNKNHLYAYDSANTFEIVNDTLRKLNTRVVVNRIWESPSGQLYFQKDRSIYATDHAFASSKLIYTIPGNQFKNQVPINFCVLPSGNICLGFEKPELHNNNPVYFLVNPHTGDIIDFSKSVVKDILTSALIVDNEGNLWLGTDGLGLYHIFDCKYKQIGGDNYFCNSNITSLYSFTKDSLYVGTREGLYVYHNLKTSLIKLNDDGIKPLIKKIFPVEHGIGVSLNWSKGLGNSYSVINGRVHISPYFERQIFKNYVYTQYRQIPEKITSRDGLSDYSKKITMPYIISNMEEDGLGRLWINNSAELYSFHPFTGFRKYRNKQLENLMINCLKYDPGKGLWIGTSHGLFLMSLNGTLQHWGAEEGLMNLAVRSLLPAENNALWLGTQNGLFYFKDNKFTIYKKRNGLIADDVSCIIEMAPDKLAIGSSKGITFFVPNIPETQIEPKVAIEKLLINNEKQSPDNIPGLLYNSTIFLKYRLITYIYPELVSYQYRMNKNENWITTQNNNLVFTNLKPGDYNFELRAKKYNTDFSTPVAFHFIIKSPWWKSIYFYAGILILFISLFYFYLKHQLTKHKQQSFAKFELAELKMKALQAQLNPHFISNALNAIQYFILQRDEVAANNYLSRFTDLTRLFLEVSRKGLVTLETELELLNNYLSLEKLRFENKFDFSIVIHPSIDIKDNYIPGLLIQPFVENSINHGIVYLPKGKIGLVLININKTAGVIDITINDNGIGRKKAKEMKSRLAKSYRSHSSLIVEELKQAYNTFPGCEISIEAFDKTGMENEPLGTCIYIKVKINKELINPNLNYNENYYY